MTKVLILNLPGPVLKAGSRWYNTTKSGGANLRYYPYPWFMGYATALLKENGFNVAFKDAVAMGWTELETLNYIRTFDPTHIVCEPTWASVETDRILLRAMSDKVVKIAVGNYATNYPLECLKDTGVDYVVVGEYELSLLEFFKKGKDLLPKNFVSAQKTTFEQPDLMDLDLFPYPERDDTSVTYYNEPSCYGKNIVMVSSRGCRLKCSFCNVECIYGKHAYRVRSPQSVVDEMEYLQRNYDFDEIYFDDDNMVAQKKHIDDICKEIIARDLDIKWLCMGDGLVDDETLTYLARAGCTTYKYGLEHLDDAVLRAIPKPLKGERLLAIIKKCRELGMRSYVNLIVGLPESTKEKDLKMLTSVFRAKPDLIQIAIATPYPGTGFYGQAKEKGWLISTDPGYFDATGKSPVSYPNYSAKEIEEVFYLGWRMWYRHVLFRQPKTLWFFVSSELKRNGLASTLKKAAAYFAKMLTDVEEEEEDEEEEAEEVVENNVPEEVSATVDEPRGEISWQVDKPLKVLITGSEGYIGTQLVGFLASKDIDVYKTVLELASSREGKLYRMDITDPYRVLEVIREVSPDVVVHTAAVSSLKKCEEAPVLAEQVNVVGTYNIVKAIKEVNPKIRLIFMSSDYVFDGERGDYREEDPAYPKTVYGQTKRKAEQLIQAKLADYVIVRTANVYGRGGNFFNFIVEKIKEGMEVDLFDNVFYTPTYIEHLLNALYSLVEKDFVGVIHVAGLEKVSRYDFAVKVAQALGADSTKLKRSLALESNLIAKDSSLNTALADTVLGFTHHQTSAVLGYLFENVIPPYFSFGDARGQIVGIFQDKLWEEVNYAESKKGCVRGNHYHKDTQEAFFIIEGKIMVTLKSLEGTVQKRFMVQKFDTFIIYPSTVHVFEILEDSKWINMLSKAMVGDSKDIHKA